MRINRRWMGCMATGMGFLVVAASGCQTYMGGMTLPSGQYLKHAQQYFPPDPTFSLQREVDSMSDPEGAVRRSGGAGAASPAPSAPQPAVSPSTAPLGAPTPR